MGKFSYRNAAIEIFVLCLDMAGSETAGVKQECQWTMSARSSAPGQNLNK